VRPALGVLGRQGADPSLPPPTSDGAEGDGRLGVRTRSALPSMLTFSHPTMQDALTVAPLRVGVNGGRPGWTNGTDGRNISDTMDGNDNPDGFDRPDDAHQADGRNWTDDCNHTDSADGVDGPDGFHSHDGNHSAEGGTSPSEDYNDVGQTNSSSSFALDAASTSAPLATAAWSVLAVVVSVAASLVQYSP
jgi:hypothetical protein